MKVFKALRISFLAFAVLLSTFSSYFAPGASAADENIYVSSQGSDSEGTGKAEAPFGTIEKALTNISAAGTIVLRSDITLDGTLAINAQGKNIHIQSDEGHVYSIIRG